MYHISAVLFTINIGNIIIYDGKILCFFYLFFGFLYVKKITFVSYSNSLKNSQRIVSHFQSFVLKQPFHHNEVLTCILVKAIAATFCPKTRRVQFFVRRGCGSPNTQYLAYPAMKPRQFIFLHSQATVPIGRTM